MKRMASLSIILMLSTLIPNFDGMNVEIHLEKTSHAFDLIIFFSIGLSALAFTLFEKLNGF